MFIAYNCNGCSTATLTYYKNNNIYEEKTQRDEFTNSDKDDRIYIGMRRSRGDSGLVLTINLKEAAIKKMRLRVVGYFQAEYRHALSNKGYIIT